MDIDRLQSAGLVIIRPKSTQSDRKSDLLKIFRPESVKILKKGRQHFGDLFSIYFVFKTSFLAFIFSPATESSIFPGLSPALNITRAEPWKRLR